MKMVNNGYVSRIPQNLEGTIEELQEGGSGGGGVLVVSLNTNNITDLDGTALSYNDIINAGFVVGKTSRGTIVTWYALSETSGWSGNPEEAEEYAVTFSELAADSSRFSVYTGDSADGPLYALG